jgi:SAM-dependent methyltransferase
MAFNRSVSASDEAIRARSLLRYRSRVVGYDRSCGPTWPIRVRAVSGLHLQPGQRVLDVGCGTGLSLALLRRAVGDAGLVFGCDQSPQMLALARQRVAAAGWRNVHLFEVPAHELGLPEPVDALLFHYTHDILRSPMAVERLLQCARPGAAVAVAGIKYFPRWLAPLNLWVYFKNLGYNGSPGQLAAPWDRIAPRLAGWQRSSTQFGMGYLAFGRVDAQALGAAASARLADKGLAPAVVQALGSAIGAR